MKRISKLVLILVLVFTILTSVFSINTFAAGTILSFSKSTLTVGDTVTVTVTLDAGEAMYSAGCVVNYDSNVLNYTSGQGTGGAGSIKIVESPSGETKVSYSLTFTALAAGSSTVSVIDCQYDTLGENGAQAKSLSGASANISVKDVSLSSNANLKSLSLSAGTLSPRFSASTTTYNVSVSNSITQCKIYATAADSAAKISVAGSANLKLGKNTRSVTVTAPDGTQKTYTINITRSETEDPVSSEETTTEEPDPLETVIEDVPYTVATDISGIELFKGFSPSTANFNGQEVAIATDENNNLKIYYLKSADSDILTPYLYDEIQNIFTKLPYFIQGDNTYIFTSLPEDMTLPENYYSKNTQIAGFDVECYADNNSLLSDFYYIYCFSDGKYGMYRFDSKENCLQRFPELELISKDAVGSTDVDDGILTRFNSLSANAKIIVVLLLLVILAAIVLIVLLILKFVRKNDEFDDESDFIDFDSIEITDDYSILDNSDNTSLDNDNVTSNED